MRIKDEIFCFTHLRWCHNGWASNILVVVDTGYAGIHHSKYWMPIHYDTIEDGQNKKSHLLFSNCRNTCRFRHKRLITLASTVTMFVNSVHIFCARKKKKSFANKQKEENCSKPGDDCLNCKLLKHYHHIDVF